MHRGVRFGSDREGGRAAARAPETGTSSRFVECKEGKRNLVAAAAATRVVAVVVGRFPMCEMVLLTAAVGFGFYMVWSVLGWADGRHFRRHLR
jgi:hypothetical protein